MRIIIISFIILLVSLSNLQSQLNLYNEDGTVSKEVIEKYEIDQLKKLYDKDSKEYSLLKSAKSYYSGAQVFSFVGGALIGWPLGIYIRGDEANWTLAYAGLGGIGIAFIFATISQSYIDDSIDLYVSNYNSGLAQIYSTSNHNFNFTSVGLRIRF